MMKIKNTTKEELTDINEIEKKLIIRYEDPTVIDINKALKWSITKNEGNYLSYKTVYDEDKIIGWFHVAQDIDFRYELTLLYIREEYRNQGYGQKDFRLYYQ